MDDENFLDAINEDEATPAIEQPETDAQEPENEPASPPVEEPQPEQPAPAVEAPKQPDPGFVPFGAVLDERDKRKKLEAELEALRRQQAPQEPAQLPDMFEDPEGYTAAINQTFEQRLYQQTLQVSERFARKEYGNETTDAALQWAFQRCETDPYFNQQVKASGDPVGYAVQEYQRNQIVSTVTPDDFKQFMAWKQAQANLAQQAPASPAQPQGRPPKSLASAPSAGSLMDEPIPSDEEIFAETFARK